MHVVKRQRALTHGAQHGVLVSVKGVGGVSRRCVVVMGKMAVWWGSRVVETVVDVGLELGHWHHLAADKACLHCVCVTCVSQNRSLCARGKERRKKKRARWVLQLAIASMAFVRDDVHRGFSKGIVCM